MWNFAITATLQCLFTLQQIFHWKGQNLHSLQGGQNKQKIGPHRSGSGSGSDKIIYASFGFGWILIYNAVRQLHQSILMLNTYCIGKIKLFIKKEKIIIAYSIFKAKMLPFSHKKQKLKKYSLRVLYNVHHRKRGSPWFEKSNGLQ